MFSSSQTTERTRMLKSLICFGKHETSDAGGSQSQTEGGERRHGPSLRTRVSANRWRN